MVCAWFVHGLCILPYYPTFPILAAKQSITNSWPFTSSPCQGWLGKRRVSELFFLAVIN